MPMPNLTITQTKVALPERKTEEWRRDGSVDEFE
jgi:hypothetical protein